ncbi:MAG: PrsW family intramembrane metalloprotease [Clostridia bacterium]|nr:PrsW family intramembrane metalloprotease [Clostridia bacterium]
MRIFLAVSCLPSILLMIYVYKKDRVEKEPGKLLFLLFVLGAVSCLPAALLENFFSGLYTSVFGNSGLHYSLYENFLNVALFEELCKFLMLFILTHKNKNFNSLFDGIVYSVFVSLGFATLENMLYVYQYGVGTGLLRAVTAIPGHMFDGVLMGQFYGLWHLSKDISLTEKAYAKAGYIDTLVEPEKRYRYYLPLALIVPMLTHGLYDFLASYGSVIAIIIFVLYLIGLYIYCFMKINKISKQDGYEINLISAELNRKYPYLYGRLQQAASYAGMTYTPFTSQTYSPYSPQNNFSTPYQAYPGAQNTASMPQQQPYPLQQGAVPQQPPYQAPQSPYPPQQNPGVQQPNQYPQQGAGYDANRNPYQ